MPSYKLKYFNARGRAEACRWLFALAKVEYDDVRFQGEEWAALKPSTPFGMAPVLEVDGVMISQSTAMARFLGTEFGFVAESALDRARGDMVAETIGDLFSPLFAAFGEKDEEKKKQLVETYCKEKAPPLLKGFEKVLTENNGGDGYFVSDKLTWADVYVVTHLQGLTKFIKNLGGDLELDNYSKLAGLIARVEAEPTIQEWIKKRPVTDN